MIRVWRILTLPDVRITDDDNDGVIKEDSVCGICNKSLQEFCSDNCSTDNQFYAKFEYVWLFLLMSKKRNIFKFDINVIVIIFEHYLTGHEKQTTCSVVQTECTCLFHRCCLKKKREKKTFDCRKNHFCKIGIPIDIFYKKKRTHVGMLLSVANYNIDEYLCNRILDYCYVYLKRQGHCEKEYLIGFLYQYLKEKVDHIKIEATLIDLERKKKLILHNDRYYLVITTTVKV